MSKDSRITVKVNEKVHRKLTRKQYKIFKYTGKKLSFNDIIDEMIN